MTFLRLGHLTVNPRYLVLTEDAQREPPPRSLPDGVYRLTIDTGGAPRVIDLRGALAEDARRQVDDLTPASPRGSRRVDAAGHDVPVNAPAGGGPHRVEGGVDV